TNEEPQKVPREEGQRASVSTPMVTSREEIASPVELAKAYMGSRPYKVARRQDLVMHNNATGFLKSYARSASTFTQKALKYRISILEHDIRLGGPLRRIRQKANLLTLRDKRERGYMALQQPDHASQKKLLLMNASEPKIIKGAEKNRDTSMHGSGSVLGYANVPTKSTQTATKILQHLDKMDLKEKSSGSIKSPIKRTLDILHGQAVRSLEKGDSLRLLSYPLNEPPLKLPAEPPHKKRAFWTSVPGSDSALAADIVATSTLLGVSRTPALVEPPQKKCAFQMSAPEDDSFEIDNALAAAFSANGPSDGKPSASSDPKALELTSVSNSVTTNGHAKLTESNKPTNIFGTSESKDGKGNDQKAANVFGNSDAPVFTALTNGIFSFRTTTSSLFNFSSLHVSSTSIASTDTTTTVISTTTTPTPAAIFSTSTPTPVIPSYVPTTVFSFWSATLTTPTILEAETGNASVTNDKDLKSNLTNSPLVSTTISTTTGSGLFGFSSPAVTSTTNNQSQASFFNVSNGYQANTQASMAVTPFMPFLFGFGTTSILSSTSGTSPFSSLASTSSSFGVSSITASNSTSGPVTSIFWSTWDPERAYRFSTTYNDHTSTESMEEDFMQTSTPIFYMSVDSMVAEDTHVHGTRATLNN
nr:nuclear pore complex protein NUP1-like isoform X2 [Tanacetum cinerariifolium]